MAYEIRPNTGSLFKNDKRTTDNHPQAQGSALIKCPDCGNDSAHWVSAWTKRTQNGDPWQSLAFKPKEEQKVVPKPETEVEYDNGLDDESEIPF